MLSRRSVLVAALVAGTALAACGGPRSGSAACGLVQATGPFVVQQQLDLPRQLLTDVPQGLPAEMPARVVGQRETRGAVAYRDGQLAVTYAGPGFPTDSQVGYGVLIVDDSSQRAMGVLIFDASPPPGRPELGVVTSGERSVPLFGVRVLFAEVSNPRCPLLGDTTVKTS